MFFIVIITICYEIDFKTELKQKVKCLDFHELIQWISMAAHEMFIIYVLCRPH